MVLLLAGLLAGTAVPGTAGARRRAEARGAARLLVTRMRLARVQAVTRGASVALRISAGPNGPVMAAFADGNGNGVRQADILAGLDPRIDADVAIADLFPRVGPGSADGTPPEPQPPGTFDLFSFSPVGTASSGTVYLQAGPTAQVAVRVLGATARVRVLERHPLTGRWNEAP